MTRIALSAEVITSIVFGILQLILGFISLWQQRRFYRPNRMLFCDLGDVLKMTDKSSSISKKEYSLNSQKLNVFAYRATVSSGLGRGSYDALSSAL